MSRTNDPTPSPYSIELTGALTPSPEERSAERDVEREARDFAGHDMWETTEAKAAAIHIHRLRALVERQREEIAEKDAEIERLRGSVNRALDEALNSGDGSYRP